MALSAEPEMKVSKEEFPGDGDTARSVPNTSVRVLFILIGVSIVLGGIWVGLGDKIMAMVQGELGDVPVINADPSPIKVRPESPGGMQVPNQDRLVYGVIDGSSSQPRMERLLPNPEKPVEVDNVLTRSVPETNEVVAGTAPRGTADMKGAAGVSGESGLKPIPSAETVAALSATAPPPPSVAGAPRALTPSGTAPTTTAKQSAPPPPPQPKTENTVTAAPPQAPSAPAPKTAEPAAPVQQAATPPATAAPAAPASEEALNKSFRVQLAAGRSKPAIESEWDRLRDRNKDLLGDLSLQVTRIDLGATKGIFYRLRAGPLENETVAKTLCERLKQRKLGCLVVKPGD